MQILRRTAISDNVFLNLYKTLILNARNMCALCGLMLILIFTGCASLRLKGVDDLRISRSSNNGAIGFTWGTGNTLMIKTNDGNDYDGYRGIATPLEYQTEGCESTSSSSRGFYKPAICLTYYLTCPHFTNQLCKRQLDLSSEEEEILKRGEVDESAVYEFIRKYNANNGRKL